VKILIFLDDPNTAHEVMGTVGRMVAGRGNEIEVHLSRVLNFGGTGARPKPEREAVVAGVGPAEGLPTHNATEEFTVRDVTAAEEYLDRFAYRYLAGVTTKRVVFGNTPVAAIIAYAKRKAINLIVIADGGNRSIGQMLLFDGSVPLLKVPIERFEE
jgi:nucleotide-binding universal stress UspA family protein